MSRSEVLKFSAGGFRDFTRIAASDPTMWRDVFLHNKDAVLEMLAQFSEDLAKLTRAMRRGDGDTLFEHFSRTRAIRRGIVQIGQDSAAPDFGRAHPAKAAAPIARPYAAENSARSSSRPSEARVGERTAHQMECMGEMDSRSGPLPSGMTVSASSNPAISPLPHCAPAIP